MVAESGLAAALLADALLLPTSSQGGAGNGANGMPITPTSAGFPLEKEADVESEVARLCGQQIPEVRVPERQAGSPTLGLALRGGPAWPSPVRAAG